MWGKLLAAFQNRHPCSSLHYKNFDMQPPYNFVLPGSLFCSDGLCCACVSLNIGLVLLQTDQNWELICQICLSALFLSVMPCGNMWLKDRGMRKDDILKRFFNACLKLCILNLLVLIFLFCSANKIEVLFFPSLPLKYFLCSFGSYALEVQLSVWMCNSLSCRTM